MSHSRIFEYSVSPIERDDCLTVDDFTEGDYLENVFRGKFSGDYVSETREEDRKEDLEWLMGALKGVSDNIVLQDNGTLLLKPGFKDDIRDFWYGKLHEAMDEINQVNVERYQNRFNLKFALSDPLCMGFGFLFYNHEDMSLTASDVFFEFLLNMHDDAIVYIGSILDYHC